VWRIFKSDTLNKVIAGVALAVFIAGLCLLHGATGSYAVYYNASGRRLPIYSVQTDKKQVAISFDCAWGTEKRTRFWSIWSFMASSAHFL